MSLMGNIPISQDMDIYLGVPTLHGGLAKRLSIKLTGWKARSLSLAGLNHFG